MKRLLSIAILFIAIVLFPQADKVATDNTNIAESKANIIKDYIITALAAEKEHRLADALKNYYWALALNSKEKDRDAIKLPELKNRNINAAVPGRIKKILSDIDFSAGNITENDSSKAINLKITENGVPVENLDFKYSIGDNWSELKSAKYGEADVVLNKSSKNQEKLKFLIEYEYSDKTGSDTFLKDAIESSGVEFRNSDKEIVLIKKLKNNISEINKNYPAGTVSKTEKKPVSKERKVKKERLMYGGAAAAILIGVGLAIASSVDDGKDNPKSADVSIEVPLHP